MANYDYITSTGVIVPDTENTLTEVQDEFKDVFGDDLLVDPSTPQGVLIAAEASSRQSVARNNAQVANQFNPDRSGGIFLDAMVAMLGGQRSPAERSIVTAQLTGVAGAVIPTGALAATTAGDQFSLVQSVQIPTGGTVEGQFRSVETGEIPIPANSLTKVVTGVFGWETVNNSDAGVVGRLQESDAELRRRRREILGLHGQTMPEAISSAVRDVEGVRSLVFRENVKATTEIIDGQSLVAHSIYVCVQGGTDLDVATAILSRKPPGCNYNGGTVVNVVDPTTGQVYPVTFDRPTEIPVLVRVTIKSNGAIVDPVTSVKQAVLTYANGDLEDEDGFVVGGPVSPMEMAGAIGAQVPRVFITNVEVSYATPESYVNTVLDIAIDEIATIVASSITVNVI